MPRRAPKQNRTNDRYLAQIRASRRAPVFPELEGPMIEWIRRYHPLICDYLTEHLDPVEELPHWRVAYTALHEFLGGVWNQWHVLDPAEHTEQELWSSFDPVWYVHDHLPQAMAHTLLPIAFLPDAFAHHYAGFLRFLGERGVLESDQSRALAVLIHHAFSDDLGVGAA